LEFRTGHIWELIDEIFDMWENIAIKNQKVKKSKPIICTNSKTGPKMKQLPRSYDYHTLENIARSEG